MLSILGALSGCHEEQAGTSSSLDPYVDNPAYATLVKEGSLHTFTFTTFTEDLNKPNGILNDIMVLNFDNFTPAKTTIEPKKDEDQTLNDLGWTQSAWDEIKREWSLLNSPKSASPYNKTRQYRRFNFDTGNLDAAVTALNYPIYEAIDKNIYEKHLGNYFVWDLGNYTKDLGENVSGKKLIDYKQFYGFDLLPNVEKWGLDLKNNNVPVRFSTNARIYGATFSVAEDALVIESVFDNNNFNLTKTKFGTGQSDIETALLAYQRNVARLEYNFTLNYGYSNKIYMSFDTISNIAYLYPESSGIGGVEFSAPYTVKTNPNYIEINTANMTESERIILKKLPTYFNPIIMGPFTDDGSVSNDPSKNSFFYGKRYIKTDKINRLKLSPVFIFNTIAKNDIENAFKQWRIERHLEDGI